MSSTISGVAAYEEDGALLRGQLPCLQENHPSHEGTVNISSEYSNFYYNILKYLPVGLDPFLLYL